MFNPRDKETRKQAMGIAAELSQEESAVVVFLCMDFAKDYLVTGEVKELFEILSKQNLLSLDLLTELLYRIRRRDILRKMKVDVFSLESDLRSGKGYISSYRQLLVDISEGLSQEDLKSVLFLLGCQIPKGRLETVKTFLDLVVELEKAGKIDESNLTTVEDCLTNIRRIDLKRKILKYKQMSECTGPINTGDNKYMGECVHSVRRSNTYQNVIPISVPQQECGFGPEHVGQNWALGSVQPVFTNQLLGQHVHSNWPRLSIVSSTSEAPGAAAMSSPVHESVQATSPGTSCTSGLETYNMQSNPTGLCLIIDCIGNDANLLKETFEALHFRVLLHLYVELSEMENILKETSERDDLAALDCFVCCIISRGTWDCVLAVDGNIPGLSSENIQCYFKGQYCRPLLGKPRLFFVQNYLGPTADSELEIAGVPSSGDPIEVDGRVWGTPQEADILWGHCRVSQNLLHQAPQQPSPFMSTLSMCLRKHQRRWDLISILTEVNRKMMSMNQRLSQLQPMPLILQHTLRKKLVFP